MSADEVQRSFAGASPKGYAKPFGRQKSFALYRYCTGSAERGPGVHQGGPPAPGGHMGCRGCALAYMGQGHQPQEAHAPRDKGKEES